MVQYNLDKKQDLKILSHRSRHQRRREHIKGTPKGKAHSGKGVTSNATKRVNRSIETDHYRQKPQKFTYNEKKKSEKSKEIAPFSQFTDRNIRFYHSNTHIKAPNA